MVESKAPPVPKGVLDNETRRTVETIVAQQREQLGALLPILHAIQDAIGYVPPSAVTIVARALNLSRAEVHGVISFYPHFRSAPPGRHVIQICQAEACQSMGSAALTAHAKEVLGTALHATSADGTVTLEPIYCLGNCACSPAIMIDDDLHGRVTPARFDALLAELKEPA